MSQIGRGFDEAESTGSMGRQMDVAPFSCVASFSKAVVRPICVRRSLTWMADKPTRSSVIVKKLSNSFAILHEVSAVSNDDALILFKFSENSLMHV